MSATQTVFGVGCTCEREHFCGHCMSVGKFTPIDEKNPFCRNHGVLTGKDVVTMYPEGHFCGYKPKTN